MESKNTSTNNLKNLLARVVAMLLQFIVTWYITKILVAALGEEANGYYQMSNDFVNYAQIIAIALNSMGSRFITMAYYKESNDELNKYYNSLLFGDIILALGMAIPLALIALNLSHIIRISKGYIIDVEILFAVMFLNFLFNIFGSAFSTATFVKNRIDLDSYRIIESTLIRLGIIVVLFKFFPPHIYYVALGTLVGTIFIIFRNMHYTKILVPEVKLFKKKYFQWNYIKELVCSGAWNSITQIGSILLNGLDLLVANQLVSSVAMGVLSISKTIPKYFLTMSSTVASVFIPSVLINYAENNTTKTVKSIYEAIKVNSLFCLMFVSIMGVLGQRIYTLWVPSQNAETLQILTVISMVGTVFLMPLEILWSVFTATNKVRISSIYLIIEALVTISLEFTFLHFAHGDFMKTAIIAGTSSVIELIRSLTFLPLMGAWLLHVPYRTFYKPMVRVVVCYIVTIVVAIPINRIVKIQGWIGLIVSASVILIICFLVGWFILFDKDEKSDIKGMIKAKIHK